MDRINRIFIQRSCKDAFSPIPMTSAKPSVFNLMSVDTLSPNGSGVNRLDVHLTQSELGGSTKIWALIFMNG